MKPKWIIALFVLALLAIGGWYLYSRGVGLEPVLDQVTSLPAESGQIAASGTIEADQVRVTAQVPGRIESLLVDEGDEVKAGQVIARLDEALLRAELKKAQAALAAARAQLAQAEAGARPEDIRKAEALVLVAQATLDGAHTAWQDAQAARTNPQELNLKIAAARAELAVAEARLAQAIAGTGAPQAQYELLQRALDMVSEPVTVCYPTPDGGEQCREFGAPSRRVSDLSYQANVSAQQLAVAWDNVGLATSARDLAQANLNALLAQREDPLTANARVNGAYAEYQAAAAALKEAQAAVAIAKMGASPQQIQAAHALVKQAQAGVQAIEVQLAKMTLFAPSAGLVAARSAEEGEMAAPGVSLVTLANLDRVDLTLYIPETQIARVHVGQRVLVQVDSFPGRTFEGQITFVSSQAEFTPRNVQTPEERAKTVYAVKVRIDNPDHALKPGMPADARIEEVL